MRNASSPTPRASRTASSIARSPGFAKCNSAVNSTGPRTARGKAASRSNACRHGLRSKTVAPSSEDASELTLLRAVFQNEYQPATPADELCVLTIAPAVCTTNRIDQPTEQARQTSDTETLVTRTHTLLPYRTTPN